MIRKSTTVRISIQDRPPKSNAKLFAAGHSKSRLNENRNVCRAVYATQKLSHTLADTVKKSNWHGLVAS